MRRKTKQAVVFGDLALSFIQQRFTDKRFPENRKGREEGKWFRKELDIGG
jgi:hypothetical protein